MNYNKKRKRQSGRQARQVQDSYQVWIDDECKIHATLVKARKKAKEPYVPVQGNVVSPVELPVNSVLQPWSKSNNLSTHST